jgi:hypothetical protein
MRKTQEGTWYSSQTLAWHDLRLDALRKLGAAVHNGGTATVIETKSEQSGTGNQQTS